MSEEIRITIKPTTWIFSENELEPRKHWQQIEKGVRAHKVEIRLDEFDEPEVVITEHDRNDRRKYVTIYRSSEIPMSAADAGDLLERIMRKNNYTFHFA